MPAIDVLADKGPAPILLEINGGSESSPPSPPRDLTP